MLTTIQLPALKSYSLSKWLAMLQNAFNKWKLPRGMPYDNYEEDNEGQHVGAHV